MPHLNHIATAANLTAQAALLEARAERELAAYATEADFEAEMG